MRRAARALLAGILTIAPMAAPQSLPRAAAAQVLFSDGFHDPTTTSSVTALNVESPGLPCLTAGADPGASPIPGCGGSTDPAGSGVLRLNDNQQFEDAALTYQPGFPLAQGLSVEFKLYMYGGAVGGRGDGVSFEFAVAPPPPGQLGPNGGALGYSSNVETQPGLPAGWLGVGFDTYGNYAPASGQPEGCLNAGGPAGGYPNAVSVRGPGNGSTGYCMLSSTGFGGAPLGFTLDGPDAVRSHAERGVKIVIDPSAGTYTVGMDPTGGTTYSTVTSGPLPSSYYDQLGNQQTGLPAQLMFVVVGTTGELGTDFHEISDLSVSNLSSVPPPPPTPPLAPAPAPIHRNDHAGSNDPNPNTNPTTARVATTNNPTVSTSCSSACSLGAVTRDERVTIDAADTTTTGGAQVPAFSAASVGPAGTPVFSLTIDGGGARPSCPGYRPRDRDWVQFAFESGGSTFRKTGTMTPNFGTPRAEAEDRLERDQVCFSAPYRFTARPGFRLRRAGTWFDGVLPECAALPARSRVVPCVIDRSIVRIGDGWGVRLEFWVPQGRQDPKALG
jgi:hypothetical protein